MLLLCEIKASVHIRLGLRFFLGECLHSVEEALSPLRQQQTRRRRKEESGGSGPLRFPNVEGRKKSWAEQDIPPLLPPTSFQVLFSTCPERCYTASLTPLLGGRGGEGKRPEESGNLDALWGPQKKIEQRERDSKRGEGGGIPAASPLLEAIRGNQSV